VIGMSLMRQIKFWEGLLPRLPEGYGASISRFYTPHVDTGDYIVVINADKIRVTGNKERQKIYYHHTGYPGGIKETAFFEMMAKHPERIIEKAVKGMLPKGPLGYAMAKNLKSIVAQAILMTPNNR